MPAPTPVAVAVVAPDDATVATDVFRDVHDSVPPVTGLPIVAAKAAAPPTTTLALRGATVTVVGGVVRRNDTFSSLFGVPAGTPVILPDAAFAVSAAATAAGEAEPFVWRYSAAAPATWGDAIDVPLISANAVVPP